MKLLVVAHHLVVREYQELWVEAARQFPELEIEIVCPRVYGERGPVRARALEAALVPVRTLRASFARAGRQHLHVYHGLGATLDELAPDWIYCSEEPNSLVTAQLARAAERRGIPFLFWTSLAQRRVWRERFAPWNPRRWLFPMAERISFAQSAGAVATSAGASEVLRARGYRGPIVERPTHGVGAEFLDVGRARLGRAPGRPFTIGFVGHLEPVKGVDLLLRAHARSRTRAETRLVVRGRGPCAAELRALAEELELVVQWEDFVPYEAMPAAMGELDLLVLPSIERGGVREKFGRVLIEAMAAGAVALGSHHGGIPLALDGAGRLFPEGDVDALAALLDELVRDRAAWSAEQSRGHRAVTARWGYASLARGLVEEIRAQLGWFRSAA